VSASILIGAFVSSPKLLALAERGAMRISAGGYFSTSLNFLLKLKLTTANIVA